LGLVEYDFTTGKMKGSGDVKASTNGTIRQNAWQAIADILNA
jgi:hypothetical protein